MSSRRPSPAALTVDCMVVGVLSTLCLLGLDGTFSSRAYLVVGLIGVAGAMFLALVVNAYGRGTDVFLLCFIPGYVVLGASSALRSYEYLGFPTPDALVQVLTATISAPRELLTTIPPLDASGQVMVLPHAIGFLAGGAATWLALRTRRPAAALAPLVVALVVTIVLGTQAPDRLLLRSAVFAGISLWWITVRGSRAREIDEGQRGGVLRAVGAAVLVGLAATAVPLVAAPDVPSERRTVLRGHVGSGEDVSNLDNPLASFRRFTRQPEVSAGSNVFDRRMLKTIGVPPGQRLRFVALDVYDGTNWKADNRTVAGTNDDLFQRIASVVAAARPGRRVEIKVEVKDAYTSGWLPLAGQLTRLTFDYRDGRAQREHVRYNPATSTAMVVGEVSTKDDYTFTAELPDTRLRRSMDPYPTDGPLQAEGAFLDDFLRPWADSSLRPMAQVYSLARYLRRNGRYSDGAEDWERRFKSGHSTQRLDKEFVGGSRIVGDDEQYAALMALAANRLGVPARVVVGAIPKRNGWVKGSDVSAWVEIRVDDGSWRTLPTELFMSHRPPKRNSPPKVRPTDFVRDEEADADTSTPGSQDSEQPSGNNDVSSTDDSGSRSLLLLLLPVIGLAGWLIPGAKLLRRRRRRSASRSSARFVGGWREVLDLARDQGRGVPSALIRTEQARRLGRGEDLAREADARIFAPGPPSDSESDAFWARVDEERRAMNREAGLWARFRGFWSPLSLLPSRRLASRAPVLTRSGGRR